METVFIATPLSIPHTNPSGRIVYTCFIEAVDQICSIDADGANRTQLTATDTTDRTASFTPGQQSILFSSSRSGIFGLFEADSRGDNPRPLLPTAQGDYAPITSPDEERVAFVRAEDGNQNIWVVNHDGSAAQPLTAITGDALSPSWSPDSQQIAFAQKRVGEAGYALIIMNADGSNPYTLPLPLSDIYGHTDWSPDGNWLAFYAGSTNRRDIYLVAVDGTAYYRITDSGDNLGPSFSADSNWLVFTSSRDGDNDLYLIRLDGTELIPLTKNDTSDWQPSWGKY
jgi:Tol biopolymer transport system component